MEALLPKTMKYEGQSSNVRFFSAKKTIELVIRQNSQDFHKTSRMVQNAEQNDAVEFLTHGEFHRKEQKQSLEVLKRFSQSILVKCKTLW